MPHAAGEGSNLKDSGKLRAALTATLLTAAVALIVVGLLKGEFRQVLQKAAAICLECVGIG